MSGHSRWAQIKHQKGITDKKRGVLFSKLLAAVTAAAKQEPNPDFNPRLRDRVKKAKEAQVPVENIERAMRRAAEAAASVEEILCEAYGPGGAALLIEAITDNRNRTVSAVKKVLAESGGKWAEAGSVRWAFELEKAGHEWKAKFLREISAGEKEKLAALVAALEEQEEVQNVATNAK